MPGNASHNIRMYSPSLDAMMKEVVRTLGNIDFEHEIELDRVESRRTQAVYSGEAQSGASREAPALCGPSEQALDAATRSVLRGLNATECRLGLLQRGSMLR
jgi:hypothetical protein